MLKSGLVCRKRLKRICERLALKAADLPLARDWRFYTREVFENAFATGYLVTDFVHDNERSFYVLMHEDSTLQDDETHANLRD